MADIIMAEEKTIEEQIKVAIDEVHDAMLENITASRAVVDSTLAKQKSKHKLQDAKKRLETLEKELMEL